MKNASIGFIVAFSLVMAFQACTDEQASLESASKVRVDKILRKAENVVRVMGRTTTGLDPRNGDFETVSAQVIKSLSYSAYEARKAYLQSEICLSNQKAGALETREGKIQPQMDSIYLVLLKNAVLRIDSLASHRTGDPTIQDLMVEVEQLNDLKEAIDQLCD